MNPPVPPVRPRPNLDLAAVTGRQGTQVAEASASSSCGATADEDYWEEKYGDEECADGFYYYDEEDGQYYDDAHEAEVIVGEEAKVVVVAEEEALFLPPRPSPRPTWKERKDNEERASAERYARLSRRPSEFFFQGICDDILFETEDTADTVVDGGVRSAQRRIPAADLSTSPPTGSPTGSPSGSPARQFSPGQPPPPTAPRARTTSFSGPAPPKPEPRSISPPFACSLITEESEVRRRSATLDGSPFLLHPSKLMRSSSLLAISSSSPSSSPPTASTASSSTSAIKTLAKQASLVGPLSTSPPSHNLACLQQQQHPPTTKPEVAPAAPASPTTRRMPVQPISLLRIGQTDVSADHSAPPPVSPRKISPSASSRGAPPPLPSQGPPVAPPALAQQAPPANPPLLRSPRSMSLATLIPPSLKFPAAPEAPAPASNVHPLSASAGAATSAPLSGSSTSSGHSPARKPPPPPPSLPPPSVGDALKKIAGIEPETTAISRERHFRDSSILQFLVDPSSGQSHLSASPYAILHNALKDGMSYEEMVHFMDQSNQLVKPSPGSRGGAPRRSQYRQSRILPPAEKLPAKEHDPEADRRESIWESKSDDSLFFLEKADARHQPASAFDVRLATVNQLVILLTESYPATLAAKKAHHQFAEIFFDTFRVLLTHDEVYQKIVDRFWRRLPGQDSINHNQVRRTVLATLSFWYQGYPADFPQKQYEACIIFSRKAQGEVREGEVFIGARFLEKLLSSRNRLPASQLSQPQQQQQSALKPGRWESSFLDMFLTVEAVEIARQISLGDHKIFCSVKNSELLSMDWNSADPLRKNKCPALLAVIERFNLLTTIVMHLIVSQKTIAKRKRVIVKIIDVMRQLYDLNNFFAVIAFSSCFSSASIKRLKHTLASLDIDAVAKLDTFHSFSSPVEKYAAYRKVLASVSPPSVLYLGPFLQEFVYINEKMPTYKSGLINFSKCRTLSVVIQSIVVHQKFVYPSTLNATIQQLINCYPSISEDDLYDLSLACEPRGASRKDIK